MPTTTRKASVENQDLRGYDYFTIILPFMNSTITLGEYTRAGRVCAPLNQLNTES